MKIELTYLQLVLIGMGVVFILGLIPLILGLIKGKKKLAILGLVASIAAGTIQSLLALITVIVFIWLILRKPAENNPVKVETVNQNPIDVSVKDPENQVSGD
jgi:SNF family Na+-dependent transporter